MLGFWVSGFGFQGFESGVSGLGGGGGGWISESCGLTVAGGGVFVRGSAFRRVGLLNFAEFRCGLRRQRLASMTRSDW